MCGKHFVNLYDDNNTDVIVPTDRIYFIERGPRPGDTDIENDQFIKVTLTSNGTMTLYYDDEVNCDDAFEHFVDQLCDN